MRRTNWTDTKIGNWNEWDLRNRCELNQANCFMPLRYGKLGANSQLSQELRNGPIAGARAELCQYHPTNHNDGMRNAWEVTGLRSRSSKPQRQAFPSLTDQQGPLDPCAVAPPMHAQPLRLCNVDQVTVLVTYTLIYKIQPTEWTDLLPLS